MKQETANKIDNLSLGSKVALLLILTARIYDKKFPGEIDLMVETLKINE